MKIAVLHSGDLEKVSLGGVDRYVKSIIEFSPDKEITIFGTGVEGEVEVGKEYIREYHGKEYYFIPITTNKRKPLSIYYMLCEFIWIKKLSSFDCIYAQRTEYSIPFVCSKSKSKLIQLIHGSSRYSEIGFGHRVAKVHLFLEKLSIAIAKKTYIILNREEYGVPYYKKKYPKYADRIFYQRNIINPANYPILDEKQCRKDTGIPYNVFNIIFVGRVEQNPKRVLLFPKIVKELHNANYYVHFTVVGDGSDRERLQEKVKEMDLCKYFSFAGYIEDTNEIAKYYNASDLAINISMFEGTCTSNIEALSTGTPLLSTDVGDIREIIENGYNGIIIPNFESEEELVHSATEGIIKIIKNKPTLNQIYLKYSGPQVVKQLLDEICEL